MRQIIIPDNEQHWLEMRTRVVTSTEVAALFGISPYTTAFELWNRKKNQQYVKIDPNERMELGIALQDAIAKHIGDKNDWFLRRMNEFIFDDQLRIGASFDFEATAKDMSQFLLEIKNVDGLVYKNDWIPSDTGAPQAPLHIECQVQMEMLVSGRDKCLIGACIGGNHIELIERTADKKVQDAILAKCSSFWASVDAGIGPLPNFQEDAGFINTLYSFAEPGTVIDISSDDNLTVLASDYKKFGDDIKALESDRDAIKAQLLTAIGNAERANGNGFSITAGMVAGTHVEYDRAGFRNFRINWKKSK
jgi:putative phage-type endonuclease